MKRVLLITYYFPPEPEPGALRAGYLARYLPEFGWQATVVTPGTLKGPINPGSTQASDRWRPIKRTPLARFLKALWQSIVHFPDNANWWFPRAVREALALSQSQRYDAILSSALPASVHLAAAVIAKRLHLPWVADYRDLWTGYVYRRRGPIRRFLDLQLEKLTLGRAGALVAVSDDVARSLHRIHRLARITVIPNASDVSDWADIADAKPDEFVFCYAGRLYGLKRSPELVFAVTAKLREEKHPAGVFAKFHFYGPDASVVEEMAARYGLAGSVSVGGVVPRRTILRMERSAAVLLLLLNMDERTVNEYGSKIYEYAQARRPVLAIGPAQSVLRPFVRDSGLGHFVSTSVECESALKDLYRRFSQQMYEPDITPGWAFNSGLDLAQAFALTLDSVSGAGNG